MLIVKVTYEIPTEPLKGHGLQFLDIISFERNLFRLNEIISKRNKISFPWIKISFQRNVFQGNKLYLYKYINKISFPLNKISFERNVF